MTFYGSRSKVLGGLGLVCACEWRKVLAEAVGEKKSRKRPMPDGSEVAAQFEKRSVVTRAEAAVFLRRSYRQVQRMEAKGVLTRCPGYDVPVMYAARDVLRLASAHGKER